MSSIKRITSRLTASLAGLVFENNCPSCGLPADSLDFFPICSLCMASVTAYSGPACKRCAKPFASRYSDTCGDCLSDMPAFERALSYGLYEGTLMEAIHLMKFRGVRRLARPLSAMLSRLVLPGDADIIMPVPMTRAGLISRGFNQSALVARALGKAIGIPLRLDILMKTRETPPQLGLSRRARLRNLRGAFSAVSGARGLRVIVLDDVITTGATMRECSKVLKGAGAEEVTALSIARTY